MREVLERASARLPRELPAQPETQAYLRLAMGFLYYELKGYTNAQAEFFQARETCQALHGPENAGVAACTLGLALVNLRQGNYAAACAMARSVIETGRRVFPTNDTVLAHARNCLAAALLAQHATNQLEEAEEACRTAIAIARTHEDKQELLLANSLFNLGQVLRQQGKPADAAQCFHETLRLREKLLGNANAQVAEVSNQLFQAQAEASQPSETLTLKGKTNAPAR